MNPQAAACALSTVFLALAAPAVAQSALGGDWFFDLGGGTDNRSKGASKSGNDPYAFGSATWVSGDGLFYVSPAVETVSAGGSDVEAELSIGYQPEAFGYLFDFNVAYKNRLGARSGYDEDTIEFTGNISRSIGPASARLQLQYSPDAAGSTKGFSWVEGRLGWDFNSRLEGSAALGRREQDNAPDYTAWNAGVTYAMSDALDLDLRWYDTSASDLDDHYRGAVVAKVSYAF